MSQRRSSQRQRSDRSVLSLRTHIPARRSHSIPRTEPDKVFFPLLSLVRMSLEECCPDPSDRRRTQSALRTIGRAANFPTPAAAYPRSKRECIQIRIEPLPPRSGGNDWIATRRQRLMSSRPAHALPLREILTCVSYCRRK